MTNAPVHTETEHGLILSVFSDPYPENPFEFDDGLPDLITWHRRYDFSTRKEDKNKSAEMFLKEAKRLRHISLPLFLYDHSGLRFSTSAASWPFSCRWDSGQVGFVFWTREKLKALGLTHARRERKEKELKQAVQLLDDYASGNVYGFTLTDSAGNELDACWGFFGDYDAKGGALTAGREALAYHLSPQSLPLFANLPASPTTPQE